MGTPSGAELSALIGRDALWCPAWNGVKSGMMIPVRIVDFRTNAGKRIVDFLVTPVHGSGTRWVSRDSLELL